jgi:hypothetical protein
VGRNAPPSCRPSSCARLHDDNISCRPILFHYRYPWQSDRGHPATHNAVFLQALCNTCGSPLVLLFRPFTMQMARFTRSHSQWPVPGDATTTTPTGFSALCSPSPMLPFHPTGCFLNTLLPFCQLVKAVSGPASRCPETYTPFRNRKHELRNNPRPSSSAPACLSTQPLLNATHIQHPWPRTQLSCLSSRLQAFFPQRSWLRHKRCMLAARRSQPHPTMHMSPRTYPSCTHQACIPGKQVIRGGLTTHTLRPASRSRRAHSLLSCWVT